MVGFGCVPCSAQGAMRTENGCPATKHAAPTLRKPSEHERRDDKARPVTAALVGRLPEAGETAGVTRARALLDRNKPARATTA